MFNIIFKNGYEMKADSVREDLRNFSIDAEVVLVLQSNTTDKLDILDLKSKIKEGIEEIKVMEGADLTETHTSYHDYRKVISINKSLQASGAYFYDVQLGK